MTTPNIEELLKKAKRLRNELDDSNARLDRQCVTAMYEMEQALQSQAERIKELIDSVNFKHSKITELENERDTLRAQLAEIEKTEPVAWLHTGKINSTQAFTNEPPPRLKTECQPLFIRPMPALGVNALDAALGKTAMRFVDRAGDVHPGIDDADRICAEFYKAMVKTIDDYKGAV